MFRRLLFDHWVSIFTIIAFITSASIYAAFAWRALRMKRGQIDRLAQLPFDSSPKALSSHDA